VSAHCPIVNHPGALGPLFQIEITIESNSNDSLHYSCSSNFNSISFVELKLYLKNHTLLLLLILILLLLLSSAVINNAAPCRENTGITIDLTQEIHTDHRDNNRHKTRNTDYTPNTEITIDITQ